MVEILHAHGRSRVHAVRRIEYGVYTVKVTFICGESTSFGDLGMYSTEDQVLTEDPVTCGRCGYSLERRRAQHEADS